MSRAALLNLCQWQAGVISRGQWLGGGGTDSRLRGLVGRGLWQTLFPGVYLTHTGTVSDEARAWSAVLYAGPDAALSRRSALWAARRNLPLSRTVELAIPRERRVRAQPGLHLDRLVRMPRRLGQLPRLTVEEATIIEAAHTKSEQAVVELVCLVAGERLSTAPRLRAALAARSAHPHRKLLNSLLADVGEGAQSPLELLDLRNDRRHGLPTAKRQVGGRRGFAREFVDAVVSVDGHTLIKELDGRLGHAQNRFRDAARDNAHVLSGLATMRFGWSDLIGDPCEVAAMQMLFWQRRGLRVGKSCSAESCMPSDRQRRLDRSHLIA